MRTCPECGKDTSAGMAEPCTKCGFSPLGGEALEEAPAFEAIGEQVAPPAPGDAETTAELEDAKDQRGFEETWQEPDAEDPDAAADPVAEQTVAKAKRKGRVQLIIWSVVGLGIWLALQNLDAFESPTGPEADEVEASLVDSAARLGVSVTAECPDDAEDTEVGDSFECVITGSDGERITLTVHNNEDEYTWPTRPLARLG